MKRKVPRATQRARSLKSAGRRVLAATREFRAELAKASIPPTPPLPHTRQQRLIEGDSAYRKRFPLTTGLLDYFPDACAAVSEVSFQGNEKHNPGEPLHHARGKSMDHADCIARHLTERGGFDGNIRHTAALAWRALALLQEELETEFGLPLPRAARLD